MMVLEALSQDTVRLIKSTQVITTPASIVKELVENSLDAGATAVTIRLEDHGFSLLEVRDNGSGIEEEDVKFVAKPHYTSKILTFADLTSLTTYGFRGEALASLCAVAVVSITTKTKHTAMGHIYTFDHTGSLTTKKPAAAQDGTTVTTRDLFKKIPVRKQYYSASKRRKEELKKVEDLVLAFTLAAPEVYFSLSHDRRTILQKSSVKNIQEALMTTFPVIYKHFVLRERHIQDIHVKVYLPGSGPSDNPNLSRTTPDRLFILVNQRPVIHKSLEKLVKAHYNHKLEGSHGRYPVGVVTLTLPPAAVDVNLEPNKTKILLRDEKQIAEAVQELLSELYGPLNQPEKQNKKDESNLSHQTDITCTFGGLVEDSDPSEENMKKIQDIEMTDDFLDLNKSSVAACKGSSLSTSHSAIRDAGGGKAASSKASSICGNVHDKYKFTKPHKGRQEQNEQKDSSFAGVMTSNPELKVHNMNATEKEKCNEKNMLVHTSTQNNSPNAYFPSIPPDDDLDFLNEVYSSTTSKCVEDILGIGPLSFSHTNMLSESDTSGYNQLTKQNQDTISTSNSDRSKLHESFTGSDGIPVYKIPPVPPLDNTGAKCGDNNSVTKTQQMNDNSSRSTSEHTSLSNINLEDIEHNKPTNPKEGGDNTAGSWSRGMPVNGKNIQTVQLLTAASLGSKPPKLNPGHGDVDKRSRCRGPQEAGDPTATPPKKIKINSLGPSGFDYIYGKPVKKPSSPFLLFSRDIRGQVLSELPGADFASVAKEMAERWKTLDLDSRNHYRELAKAEVDKYHMEVKLIKESRGIKEDSPLAKVCKTGASLDRYLAPLTPIIRNKEKVVQQQPLVSHRPWLQHSKQVTCSLDMIQDKLKKTTHPKKKNANTLTVLGRVTTSGGWVCAHGPNIMALNVYRLYEVILYNNLMKTFKISVKPLDNPMPFNASSVGLENWAALLKLPRELVPDRNFYCVSDQRLAANGFTVSLFPGATSSVAISYGEVTEMTDSVGFYGVSDLKEILSILAASPRASLEQARPLKLQHWIKAEAVRMVRSEPSILRQDDVLEKLKRLHLIQQDTEVVSQPPTELKCIHGKPLFTRLYSLDDLPMSQSEPLQNPELL